MGEQSERTARLLARALFYATDGELRWWVLPTNLTDITNEVIALAVDRRSMLYRGDSVCLTDAGQELIKHGREGPNHSAIDRAAGCREIIRKGWKPDAGRNANNKGGRSRPTLHHPKKVSGSHKTASGSGVIGKI
jgi:hypothetical protein